MPTDRPICAENQSGARSEKMTLFPACGGAKPMKIQIPLRGSLTARSVNAWKSSQSFRCHPSRRIGPCSPGGPKSHQSASDARAFAAPSRWRLSYSARWSADIESRRCLMTVCRNCSRAAGSLRRVSMSSM